MNNIQLAQTINKFNNRLAKIESRLAKLEKPAPKRKAKPKEENA